METSCSQVIAVLKLYRSRVGAVAFYEPELIDTRSGVGSTVLATDLNENGSWMSSPAISWGR
jgi:hypothetical protein